MVEKMLSYGPTPSLLVSGHSHVYRANDQSCVKAEALCAGPLSNYSWAEVGEVQEGAGRDAWTWT